MRVHYQRSSSVALLSDLLAEAFAEAIAHRNPLTTGAVYPAEPGRHRTEKEHDDRVAAMLERVCCATLTICRRRLRDETKTVVLLALSLRRTELLLEEEYPHLGEQRVGFIDLMKASFDAAMREHSPPVGPRNVSDPPLDAVTAVRYSDAHGLGLVLLTDTDNAAADLQGCGYDAASSAEVVHKTLGMGPPSAHAARRS